MKIGITVDVRHSMFSAGHPNSCIAIYEAMASGNHEVILINKDSSRAWWDDCLELASQFSLINLDNVNDLDIVIEVAFHLSPIERKRVSKRSIWYCRKPALFTDIEATVFACRIEGRNLEGLDEIWFADLYNDSDDIEYLKILYPSVTVRSVPWLWTPTIVEAHRKKLQSPVWCQNKVPSDHPWSLHIPETNVSNTSSCTIPLVILKHSGLEQKFSSLRVHNTDLISNSKFFKENVLDHCSFPELKIELVGRQRIIDWSHEPRSLILSHSRFTPLRQANLEALWTGIPLVHNNPALSKFGFYYEKNSIQGAIDCLQKIIQGVPWLHNIDHLTEIRKGLLYKFSPEAKAKEWLELLKPEVPFVLSTYPCYRVLFTDMWSEFNPSHNMFILALQEYLGSIEVKGYAKMPDGVKQDIHIFGPFGSDWISLEGPKVHFSGENTDPIYHPSVKFNIGFKNIQGERYLRMPLWMFEVDWFGADLNQIQNPIPLPVSACLEPDLIRERTKFCAFIVSNPKNSIRNEAFHRLNAYKPVDSAGNLFNNVGNSIFAGLGGGGGELLKHEFLKDYRFCLCYENESSDGYVTEKLLHAKAAGCIPIYWGASDVGNDFNPSGFINLTGNPGELVERVKAIEENSEKRLQMAKIPALSIEKATEVKGLFHEMSRKIVENKEFIIVTAATQTFWTSLIKWLENIQIYKKLINGLRAIVYVGSDVLDSSISSLKKYTFATFIRFPTECPDNFLDFWNPQHFAWKLWILKNLSGDIRLKGNIIFYMDCASVIIRWPHDWIKEAMIHKISFLEDPNNKNKNWCHDDFCSIMNVSEEEKNRNQIAACLIIFVSGEPQVSHFFSEAYELGCIRKVIVGDKWSGKNSEGEPYGHRHDQSILSILSERFKIHKYPLNKIYGHFSARSTYYSEQHVYVHRGNYISHTPLLEGIDDAYVINLNRRQDRLKSFVEHHPYFKGCVRRHMAVDGKNLKLTPGLRSLFKPNDFFWKKAVMGCALSHLKLWTMLQQDSQEINSYLIMEDDARLEPVWQNSWKSVYNKLPNNWECVYLGGVLPPNKEGFKKVLESTGTPGLCRIAPNTFFGQEIPSRQFHFCAYAYVISKRGVSRILQDIQDHGGIWTSADHVLFNSLDKENVYILDPLPAGASQDSDPAYVNSDFNNFSRIDNFDSDLWNNDERFSSDEFSVASMPLNIIRTVNQVYSVKPGVHFVSLDQCNLNNNTIYEGIWLNELFSPVPFTIHPVQKDTNLESYENLVVLLIRSKWQEQMEWLDLICKSGKSFKILHFSDEFQTDSCEMYIRPEVRGILRFYKRNDILSERVLTIPLGYHWKSNGSKSLVDRKYIWSFSGTNWKGRSSQLSPLESIEPYFLKYGSEWQDPTQLTQGEYVDLLKDTQFVPCPGGNNVETFRFYEAIESGCIPIFTELPKILENSKIPFLKSETWSDAAELIRHFQKYPEQMIQYQESLIRAWTEYKVTLKQQVSNWLIQ